jgi:Ca-activated chloride channel family protein
MQRFHNPHSSPLAVTYAFPLPDDAAVSAYAFTIAGRRIAGEIDRREAARERFEEALLAGRTAALLDQERSTLFTQELGNVPPGADVEVELTLDQRLMWVLGEGGWEWRFPTASAPRYLGDAGRVQDADRVTIDVADAPLPVRALLTLAVEDALAPSARVESPSHAIAVRLATTSAVASLAMEGGALLDRDLVVRWRVADRHPAASLDVARPAAGAPHADAAYGVLTIVPPAPASGSASASLGAHPAMPSVPRDLIVLLDTSGSMSGEPLDQARRIVAAILATLRDDDRLELLEFSSALRRWKRGPVAATEANRRDAMEWLAKLRASGGTEMRDAIVGALAALRPESQRQVVLVSDGCIGFEDEIVGAIRDRMPPSSRVHTVGVGSAANRSLTGPAARVGRGVEVLVGLGEDPERAARRIVAATAEPLVVDLSIEGAAVVAHAPARLPDLFAGAPALVGVKLRPAGGEIVVRGRTREGAWETRLVAPPCDAGSGPAGVIAFFAREAVSDLEAAVAPATAPSRYGRSAPATVDPLDAAAATADREIERIGLTFQIATRLTSWVAVTEEPTVDPGAPFRRVRVPQNLPHGMTMEGLGLRPPAVGSVTCGSVGGGVARHGYMGGPAAASARAPAGFGGTRSRSSGGAASRVTSFGGMFRVRGAQPRGKGGMGQPPLPRVLEGRISLRRGKLLIVEASVDTSPLLWDPGRAAVMVLWHGGSPQATEGAFLAEEATVAGGTHAGAIAPGHMLRLVLHFDETPGYGEDPIEIHIDFGRESLVLRLR